jgi:hypothetical protein
MPAAIPSSEQHAPTPKARKPTATSPFSARKSGSAPHETPNSNNKRKIGECEQSKRQTKMQKSNPETNEEGEFQVEAGKERESFFSSRLTARQKKIRLMNGEIESEEEKKFYSFDHLWKRVLKREGWIQVKPFSETNKVTPKGTCLDSWWYMGGHVILKSWEDVVSYCKERDYHGRCLRY